MCRVHEARIINKPVLNGRDIETMLRIREADADSLILKHFAKGKL